MRIKVRVGGPAGAAIAAVLFSAATLFAGCESNRVKSNEELGLNQQQAAGRAIFDHYCSACHSAYSSSSGKGPSLKNLFSKQFLPSGLPANDRFVEQTIGGGRGMMPAFDGALTPDQLSSLLAYLHTL
jgi:mono/diheme cytochrome c family protein